MLLNEIQIPLVSIILPTKNSRQFLDERIASIRNQTFSNFEVIAVDSNSGDGTVELIEEWSREDKRVKLFQVPPGLYRAWNSGIKKATGKYIYVATSDDTMVPECLQEMVDALENNPDCSICDSQLVLIDDKSQIITPDSPDYISYTGHFDFPREKMHVRKAPHDFFLYAGGKTVYTSITQIMIRKDLFDKTGYFPEDMGPTADYLWGFRAAASADVIFLPKPLSAWRQHKKQVTGHSPDFQNYQKTAQMMNTVLQETEDPFLASQLKKFARLVDFKVSLLPVKRAPSLKNLLKCMVKIICKHPVLSCKFFCNIIKERKNRFKFIAAYDQLLLEKIGLLNLDAIREVR